MSKLGHALALVVAMSVVTAAAVSVADAQDKKEKKEKPGTVEVYKAKDGYRIRVKGSDNKSILIGTKGFKKKEDALQAVEVARETLAKGKLVEVDDE